MRGIDGHNRGCHTGDQDCRRKTAIYESGNAFEAHPFENGGIPLLHGEVLDSQWRLIL